MIGSVYQKNTNTQVERDNGAISHTLHAYARGIHLVLAESAIIKAASLLGDESTVAYMLRGAEAACGRAGGLQGKAQRSSRRATRYCWQSAAA